MHPMAGSWRTWSARAHLKMCVNNVNALSNIYKQGNRIQRMSRASVRRGPCGKMSGACQVQSRNQGWLHVSDRISNIVGRRQLRPVSFCILRHAPTKRLQENIGFLWCDETITLFLYCTIVLNQFIPHIIHNHKYAFSTSIISSTFSIHHQIKTLNHGHHWTSRIAGWLIRVYAQQNLVVAGDYYGRMHIWRMSTGKHVRTLRGGNFIMPISDIVLHGDT
jgi:hypothetical protein